MKALIKDDHFRPNHVRRSVVTRTRESKTIRRLMILLTMSVTLSCAVTARAQVLRQRVFVSAASGVNAGSCPLSAPCNTFAYAVNHVLAGGEVIALDSGGYGTVTITKAMTITAAPGVHADIVAATAGTNAITINAGTTDTVILRNLTLLGMGADNGILITQAGAVHVENCVVSSFDGLGFNGMGIKHAAAAKLYVKDTITRDNNHSGIFVEGPVGNTALVSVDNTRADNNLGFGIYLYARAKGSISRSVANGNGISGMLVNNGNSGDPANASIASFIDCATSHHPSLGFGALGTGSKAVVQNSAASSSFHGFLADDGGELNVEHCSSLNNHYGAMVEDAGSTIRVSDSTMTSNDYGFYQLNGGLFESRGNNTVRGNVLADTSGTITVISGT